MKYRTVRLYIAFLLGFFSFAQYPAFSQNIDINVLKSINPQHPGAVFWKRASTTHVAIGASATATMLVYGWLTHDASIQHKSYETFIAIGINTVGTEVLKKLTRRTRPYDRYPAEVFVLEKADSWSFPSGHTSFAFATATSFAISYPKWYVIVPAYLWAGCVGYSRMYLGQHYPTDVLAGAIVGAGSSVASHWLTKKIFPTRAPVRSATPL